MGWQELWICEVGPSPMPIAVCPWTLLQTLDPDRLTREFNLKYSLGKLQQAGTSSL